MAASFPIALDQALGGKLVVMAGDPPVLPQLAVAISANAIHWNRAYEPWRITRDARIKAQCADKGSRFKAIMDRSCGSLGRC